MNSVIKTGSQTLLFKFERKPPTFSICMLNVHNAIKLTETNSITEGWNNTFQNCIS